MILSTPRRELGLDEELGAGDQSRRDRARDARADSRFVIVAALIGGVDAAEARLEREPRQALGRVLFPRGAIEKARSAHTRDVELPGGHHPRIIPESSSGDT